MNDTSDEKKKNFKAEPVRFLEFNLGKEAYAISLMEVREVMPMPEIRPIPNLPNYVLGIFNLRGQVISIFDLRKKCNLKPMTDNEEAVIVVDVGGMNVGIVVDFINKVLAFSSEEVSEISAIESQIDIEFISGVYKKENSLTLLIDIAKVLNIEDKEAAKNARSISENHLKEAC